MTVNPRGSKKTLAERYQSLAVERAHVAAVLAKIDAEMEAIQARWPYARCAPRMSASQQ